MSLYTIGINSSVGHLTLCADDYGLVTIKFQKTSKKDNHAILEHAQKELRLYFEGKLKRFSIPLSLSGTDYQIKCWRALQKISHGKTISYKEQAIKVAGPNHTRAVAGANNKNPLPIIIPCHRVIGCDGSLVGYAGGLKIKEKLLNLEQDTH